MARWFSLTEGSQKYSVKVVDTYGYSGNWTGASLQFGGAATFCVSIAIKSETTAYIDRVEYNERCALTNAIEENMGMEQLVRAALQATRMLFPKIQQFTLFDDSVIYCTKGSKQHKMSLARNYILKYGQTWYEKKFGARLPDLEMLAYKKSLQVLDAPQPPFEKVAARISQIKQYEELYRAAQTPREFFQALREKLGMNYCTAVAPWISAYVDGFGIKLDEDKWYILPTGEPTVRLEEMPNPPAQVGGFRPRRRKTRRTRHVLGIWAPSKY